MVPIKQKNAPRGGALAHKDYDMEAYHGYI